MNKHDKRQWMSWVRLAHEATDQGETRQDATTSCRTLKSDEGGVEGLPSSGSNLIDVSR
jgi:hypothetical protein